MERKSVFTFLFGAALLLAPAAGPPPAAAAEGGAGLAAGDPAPEFSLPGSDGKTYRLEDFRGKRAVVIAWFPKAFTSG